uniref:Ribokinase n=1 Tax=Parascaris univalens TaxID=6257 RepID=A0A915BD98_PARUN
FAFRTVDESIFRPVRTQFSRFYNIIKVALGCVLRFYLPFFFFTDCSIIPFIFVEKWKLLKYIFKSDFKALRGNVRLTCLLVNSLAKEPKFLVMLSTVPLLRRTNFIPTRASSFCVFEHSLANNG